MNKRELGRQGEEMAARYLKKQGYQILERNYHTRYGELDIICIKRNELVFVEVKTRRSIQYGTPEEAITPRKMDHLRKAAFIYIEASHPNFRELRFDVITIMMVDASEQINHIKYAF
ncbi:MAG: YraN family protein [Syntrophomonadaceae bacterium]|nr:YraN family protein [Syntrophomonadaceae bacterium]